jgi:hypothetical protein
MLFLAVSWSMAGYILIAKGDSKMFLCELLLI